MPNSQRLVAPGRGLLAFAGSLALLGGCFHDPTLRQGDELYRAKKWGSAQAAYGEVLRNPEAEEEDKDTAETGWKQAWQREQDERKNAFRQEVAKLRSIPKAADVLLAAIKLQGSLKDFSGMEKEQKEILAASDEAAATLWKETAELTRQGKFVAAEERGTRILATPGLSKSSARGIEDVRAKAAAHFAEKAKRGGPLAVALYRSLSDHFALGTLSTNLQALEESTPSYDLEVSGSTSDAECARAIKSLQGALSESRGPFRLKVKLALSQCYARTKDDLQTKTAEYFVTTPDGMKEESYWETSEKCETYPFCAPATGVGSDGRYGVYNKCVNEVRCTPTAVQRTRMVPAFKEVAQTETYTHTYRTINAAIDAIIAAEAPGLIPESEKFSATKSQTDEQFDRANKRKDTRDRRSFNPKLSAGLLFAEIEPDFRKAVFLASEKVLRQRGSQLMAQLPSEESERLEVVLRAALFGDERALREVDALFGLSREQLRSLYAGKDPLPRNVDPSPALALGTADLDKVPTPPRNRGFAGFDSTTRFELVGGLTSVDAPTPALRGESALLIGAQLASSVLGSGEPRGLQFHDTIAMLAAIGSRTSSDVFGEDHSSLALRLDADYTPLLGVRLGRFGVFGGARGRFTFANTGEISSFLTYQVPVCAKAEYRFKRYSMPAVTACSFSLLGSKYTGIEGQMPWPSGETHVFFRYEQISAPEATAGKYGTLSATYDLPFTTWFIGLGFGR